MESTVCDRRVGYMLVMAVMVAFLSGGCAGDRAMFVNVSVYVLDARGRPLAGEPVGIIPSAQYQWPRPSKKRGDSTPADLAKFGEVHKTDANRPIEFVATNTEPVEVFTSILSDMFFPPSIKFLIMLPDRQPSAYAVTFRPGGDYEKDRITYRHFDLKAGRILPFRHVDDSGGLDVAIDRQPRDPNNRWHSPRLSLRINILLCEEKPTD